MQVSRIFVYMSATYCSGSYFWNHVASIHKVSGKSMYPTLNQDKIKSDWILLSEGLADNLSKIKRGHVVVFRSVRNPTEFHIKRVIGLEGDTVKTLGYKNEYVKIPPGHCWVEGDNHHVSDDSNRIGPLPMGLITAEAKYVLHPNFKKMPQSFPHDRVSINPNVDRNVLHYLSNLPSAVL